MSLARCFDAAFPPAAPPEGAQAVLGYISAAGYDRNYHSWTPAEWAPFAGLRQFPVVELNPARDPIASADAAVARMRALGWSPGRALIGAMETFITRPWWKEFEGRVLALGQYPVCYGSKNTVYLNDPRKVWEAFYDGVPELPGGITLAKQYFSGGALDWSVVSSDLMGRGGEGLRNQGA